MTGRFANLRDGDLVDMHRSHRNLRRVWFVAAFLLAIAIGFAEMNRCPDVCEYVSFSAKPDGGW